MAVSVTRALGFRRIEEPLGLETQSLIRRLSSLHLFCSFTWNLFLFSPIPIQDTDRVWIFWFLLEKQYYIMFT